jgi:hypothetical protein
MAERLKRNTTPYRLEHKPTKRNIDHSENNFKESMMKFRMNSEEGEVKREHYIRIDNTNLDSVTVAGIIKREFNL